MSLVLETMKVTSSSLYIFQFYSLRVRLVSEGILQVGDSVRFLWISADEGISVFPRLPIGRKTCQISISFLRWISLSSGTGWKSYFHLREEIRGSHRFPLYISIVTIAEKSSSFSLLEEIHRVIIHALKTSRHVDTLYQSCKICISQYFKIMRIFQTDKGVNGQSPAYVLFSLQIRPTLYLL